jgi:uncharacterized tellurite resistance protein B-like protein
VLKALRDLIEKTLGTEGGAETEGRRHGVDLATAVLLVEVARADYEEDLTSDAAVFALLKSHFTLNDEEARLLVQEARAEADHAASLQEFTRRLHECLSVEEKHRIVEMLWEVALADSVLDKHEDHLIRKVAGLLYVSHADLIRIRNAVTERGPRASSRRTAS